VLLRLGVEEVVLGAELLVAGAAEEESDPLPLLPGAEEPGSVEEDEEAAPSSVLDAAGASAVGVARVVASGAVVRAGAAAVLPRRTVSWFTELRARVS
jgi:hypothetical protein